MGLVRQNMKAQRGRPVSGDGHIRAKIADALPFTLTNSQRTALKEIAADLASEGRMLRLLQGDVGSGKTAVALMSMAIAVEAGAQAALMAPTEVLARQHIETIAPLAEAANLRIALLTGREKGKGRDETLKRLAAGDIDILIGTHALFQSDVVFKDLAFAVIDEQHRFGVHQRLALQAKGSNGATNVLVMTATPIPRTLLMTHYGDLDVSRLTEKPAGRKPVVTKAIPIESIERLIDRLRVQLAEGAQVYWVCPLIESSDVSELAAAEERHAHLKQLFGDVVGLLHGALPAAEKDATMAAFAANELKILVATTVIEVGVNVPNANIMVIEHAERFGLAQLHQLRGRVGRGSRESFCMLLYKQPLGETAKERLDMMENTEDGFLIAEKDLELRGGGEMLGSPPERHAGVPRCRGAGVRDAAQGGARRCPMILANDPDLAGPRGKALQHRCSTCSNAMKPRGCSGRLKRAFCSLRLRSAAGVSALLAGRAPISLSLPHVSGMTIPPERMTFAASSAVMVRSLTSFLGMKQMNPVGGTMPVGMNTVRRSLSPPGFNSTISPAVSPVTNTRLHSPFDGNSMSPTFWKLCFGPAVVMTLSKICLMAE